MRTRAPRPPLPYKQLKQLKQGIELMCYDGDALVAATAEQLADPAYQPTLCVSLPTYLLEAHARFSYAYKPGTRTTMEGFWCTFYHAISTVKLASSDLKTLYVLAPLMGCDFLLGRVEECPLRAQVFRQFRNYLRMV